MIYNHGACSEIGVSVHYYILLQILLWQPIAGFFKPLIMS